MSDHYPLAEGAVQRLKGLRWAFDESRVTRYIALMTEYLKVSADWATALGVSGEWPFFDITQRAIPSLVLPTEYSERVEAILEPAPVRPLLVHTCLWYVKWELAKDVSPTELACYALSDPFVTLLTMYDEGGAFSTEHGFINIGPAGIPAMIRGIEAYRR